MSHCLRRPVIRTSSVLPPLGYAQYCYQQLQHKPRGKNYYFIVFTLHTRHAEKNIGQTLRQKNDQK